jgi:hypothetical protein
METKCDLFLTSNFEVRRTEVSKTKTSCRVRCSVMEGTASSRVCSVIFAADHVFEIKVGGFRFRGRIILAYVLRRSVERDFAIKVALSPTVVLPTSRLLQPYQPSRTHD